MRLKSSQKSSAFFFLTTINIKGKHNLLTAAKHIITLEMTILLQSHFLPHRAALLSVSSMPLSQSYTNKSTLPIITGGNQTTDRQYTAAAMLWNNSFYDNESSLLMAVIAYRICHFLDSGIYHHVCVLLTWTGWPVWQRRVVSFDKMTADLAPG